MESDGALEMYQRSAQIHVWYNPFIRDRDSSTYATVDKSRPYGPEVFTRKESVLTISQSEWVAIREDS